MASDEPKPIVLLVDDSEDVHRLIGARLRHEHAQLVSAKSGEECLRKAKEATPSVILLDLDMPVMDGFAVLRALKNERKLSSVPVVVVSGLCESSDKVTAFELGASDYVTKPFDFAELRARLRAAMRLDRLLRLLAERADVDALTGLANRAAFNKRWAQEVSENKRYKRPLTVAMFDLDHFKRINDTFGHPAGDEVITGFAKILQSSCRDADIPCRFGGEEFVLIMPQTNPTDALIVAERVRTEMADMCWPRHPDQAVTVSIGIAGAETTCGLSPEAWLEAADKALYAAKHSGRNRVVSADMAEGAKV